MSGVRAQLEARLREAIRSGQLAEGARLPSSRAYADELGVSRGTVTAAFDQLVAEGFLVATRGSGTRVAATSSITSAPSAASTAAKPRHDLRPGSPDVGSFPVNTWLRATRKALTHAPAEAFGYGDSCGRPELRTALADYLGRVRGVVTTPDRILISTSYAQTLGLVASVAASTGEGRMAFEDPGLPYHREVARAAGCHVLPVPVDERGLVTDLLGWADAVVTTAAHQYPTGVALAPERRVALTRWAAGTGGIVVEDDYDGEFRYDRQPIGALQGRAPDQVVYAGTVAKTLGPGVRLAWAALPTSLVPQVIEAKRLADHHTDTLAQLTLAELLRSHVYDRHVRAARLRYRRRRDLLLHRLAALPGLSVAGVSAGLQALVQLPHGVDEDDVIARLTERGVALDALAPHWHGDSDGRPGLLVGFGTPTENAYPAAVSALCAVLSEFVTAPSPRRSAPRA